MFSFFKRKKDEKKKRSGQKVGNLKEVGVAKQKFAIPQGAPEVCSVADRTSAQAVQYNRQKDLSKEAGHETPLGAMGNDISKPLQSLTDIPYIEVDNAPPRDNSPTVRLVAECDKNCDQLLTKCLTTDKNELKIPSVQKTSDEKIIQKLEKISDLKTVPVNNISESGIVSVTNISELSALSSPSLVKKINELENIDNAVTDNLNISAESDSVCEKCVSCDDISPTNETEEEKSVTDNVEPLNSDLARPGSVASCEEYSSDNIPDREPTPAIAPIACFDELRQHDRDMYKVTPYTQNFENGNLNDIEGYEKLKCNSEGNLYSLKKECQIVNNIEYQKSINNEVPEDTDESSEDELSESDQSESDNVVKNDSGCWDERENSLFLSESDNQVTPVCSASDIVNSKCKGNKHVRWADIDGQRKLTYERESSVCSSDSSSEDEEDDTEDEEPENDEEEESDPEEEKGEDETYKNKDDINNLTKLKLIDKGGKDNRTEPDDISSDEDSDEEEDEDSEKDVTGANVQLVGKIEEEIKEAELEESEEESEEESSEEENDNEFEFKEEEKKPFKIEIAEMQNRIADLQRDVTLKASSIDRLQVELDAACNESEIVKMRFKRLEADLDSYKQTNKELSEQINVSGFLNIPLASKELEKAERNSKQLEEADKRIKELEAELAKVKSELISLQASYKKLEADRDMEVQIIQKALEKALTDQEETEAKYDKEFENLRTLNSSREVQMLEDFEWKLREVEKSCKKKIQDFESENEKKSSELVNKLAAAQADLEQISHLKLCEIELNQLKQTSSEQRKNLRLTNRKLEELQVSEKILQEEVHSLRASLDKEKSHVATLQALHREELIDKDRKAKLKLELQINQLTNEWEERLRRENFKIKTETERNLRNEKNAAVELAKKVKDQEISQLRQSWEKKAQELNKEIENNKKKISEMEDSYRNDFDKAQTNADRDMFDLRRKMDKLDMSYQEKIEKIQEQHEKELTSLKEECDKRVQQCEANLQLQVGNSRTTIELVKQQLQNEAQMKLENLEHEYQKKLEQQWETLNKEKQQALENLEQSHKQSLESLYMEMEKIKKQSKTEIEGQGKKKNQSSNQSPRTSSVQKRNPISTRLDVAEVAEEIRLQGKEEVLQKSIEKLTKQLNAGKMEIEKLRQQLELRDNVRQQKNTPQPAPNPRRNRKPRSGRN